MSDYFFPKLEAVEALAPYCLRTVWSTGETLDVDIEARLRRHIALKAILEPEVFASVRISEWGNSIEWFDEEFGADNVYAWAKEQAKQVSHQMLDSWLVRNDLSLTTAAQALGISRRLISCYLTAKKSIPRQVWLACLGWEATRPEPTELPLGLPTVQQQLAVEV